MLSIEFLPCGSRETDCLDFIDTTKGIEQARRNQRLLIVLRPLTETLIKRMNLLLLDNSAWVNRPLAKKNGETKKNR